eukprot:3321022-Pleurochrysis_carterae.AAC.1
MAIRGTALWTNELGSAFAVQAKKGRSTRLNARWHSPQIILREKYVNSTQIASFLFPKCA